MVNVTHTVFLFTAKDYKIFRARENAAKCSISSEKFQNFRLGVSHPSMEVSHPSMLSAFRCPCLQRTPLSTTLDPPLFHGCQITPTERPPHLGC